MQGPSDQELIEQIQQGNIEAYTPIIEKYKDKIYRLLHRMIGQSQDAQDLTQEVFIKAYTRIRDVSDPSGFSSWLYRIAVNHCLDELRKRKRSPSITSSYESTLFHNDTPESIFLEKERTAILHEQIMLLNENYRMVILLRYVEHLSYKEISEVLSLPLTTVQMRLHRAHHRLREICLNQVKKGGASYDMQ